MGFLYDFLFGRYSNFNYPVNKHNEQSKPLQKRPFRSGWALNFLYLNGMEADKAMTNEKNGGCYDRERKAC